MTLRKETFVSAKRNTEYDVYIYNRCPEGASETLPYWERKARTKNMHRAVLKAKALHETRRYKRVEVKKRVLDDARNCLESSTYQVYGAAPNCRLSLFVACGVVVFALAFIYHLIMYHL